MAHKWFLGLLPVLAAFILAACGQTKAPQTPTLDPASDAGRGQTLFRTHCASCHAAIGDSVVVGPSLAGVATRAAQRVPGLSAEEYLSHSIIYPNDYIVPGYESTPMQQNFATTLTFEEVDYLVAYLLTLRQEK